MNSQVLTRILLVSLFTVIATPPASAFTILGADNSNLQGWKTNDLAFRLNPTDCGLAESEMEDAVKDALALWNKAPDSRLKLKYAGTTSTTAGDAYNGNAPDSPVIVCDRDFNTTTGDAGDNGVVGIGGFSQSGGVIVYGVLLLNSDTTQSPSRNITVMSPVALRIVIAHEIGHILGIGHSQHPAALMHYSVGEKGHLSLAQDDLDAMAYLYPRSEPGHGILGCGSLALPPSGAAGGPPSAAIALFWFLLVPAMVVQSRKVFAVARVQG